MKLKEGDRYDMNFLTVAMRKLTPLDERLIKRFLNEERVDVEAKNGGKRSGKKLLLHYQPIIF